MCELLGWGHAGPSTEASNVSVHGFTGSACYINVNVFFIIGSFHV